MDDDTKDKSRQDEQDDTKRLKEDEKLIATSPPTASEQAEASKDALTQQMEVVALTKSDKSVSTYGMPDLQDYQRAVTYEIVFNSLLEKKMQAMKRDCEERKRNKRLKRKSIGRIFLAKRLFSSVDSRKSSMISESAGRLDDDDEHLQVQTEPSTPQKVTKIAAKTAIRPQQDIEVDRSVSIQSSSQHSSQRSPRPRSKSKSNTASYESTQQQPTTANADDSVTSTLSNSSGKMVKRSVLVLAQTHGTPAEAPISSSSGDSQQAKVPQLSRDRTCDTASLASGYDNGAGARLNSNTLGDDSLTSLRDSIESLSFASSRCTVSFGATEIIPEDNDAAIYERLRAAKRQRILEAKSISAQCSPILPARHVIKTMVHAPMSPPVTKALAATTTQPPVNIIEPLPTTATVTAHSPLAVAESTARTRFLPNQFSYTDSLFESRNISRQNTSEDSANLTVSTLLNQSDSLSLHASPSPTGGFRTADFALPGKPVCFNDRFKSKSTGLLVALGNGRTRPPPPPPPCESAQPSPVALHSPPELPSLALPIEQLQQLTIASNIKQQKLVDSIKLASKSPLASASSSSSQPHTSSSLSKGKASMSSATSPRPTQSLHIVTVAATSEVPPQYPVIDSSSSSTLVGVPPSAFPPRTGGLNGSIIGGGVSVGGEATVTTAMLNGAIVTSSSIPDDTAKLHRMTSTSTGSSIGPTGCCTTTKSSSRLKEKQRFKPVIPSGQSGSDDDYRKKKRKYKRYHRCSDPVLVYPTSGGLQHCILSMPPNDPIQYPYTEDYAYDMQLQMESDKNDDLENIVPSDSTKRKHHKHRHHRHKKRHRHKKPKILVHDLETQEVKVIDPDDLPQRARWTIIATACLLLLMCLMLVGITLRMAPIIDDMDFEKKCD